MSVPTQAQTQVDDLACGVVHALSDGQIVLAVPGTDYQVQLVISDSTAVLQGKRIRGRIQGQALRLFKAHGGGRFIEPIWGEPRIVAGFVRAVDPANRRILVDVAVPIWLTLVEHQPPDLFKVGDLVNCYVKSGLQFEPVL